MALLGLGFNFGAKDSGLHKQMETLNRDFREFGKEILSVQKLQGLLAALSFSKLDQLKDRMSGIAGSGPSNLTSGIEARFQSMGIEATKMAVKLGKSADQIKGFSKQAASMADSMNIGADAAGAALQAFEYTAKGTNAVGEAFKSMGLKTAKDLAAWADVQGISGIDEFVYSLVQMQKGTKISAESLSNLVAQAKAFGATTGDTTAAIQSVAQEGKRIAQFEEIFAGKFKDAAGLAQAAADYSQSTYRLATIFEGLGGFEPGAALTSAQAVADALLKAAEDMKNLQFGEGEFSELIKSLGVVGLDQQAVADAMKKGPTEFVAAIAQSVEKSGLKGPELQQAMDAVYAKLLKDGGPLGDAGPQIARLLRNEVSRGVLTLDEKKVQEAQDAGVSVSTELAKATQNLLAATKNLFTTGRTAQELFERQVEQFEQRFRNLGSMSTNEFLKGTQQGFNNMAGLVEGLVKEGGPLGALAGKMSDIQKFGVVGIFPPEMAAQVTVFGKVTESLLGPLTALKMAGFDVLNPFGALLSVVALLGLRFFALWAETKNATKALEMLGEEVVHFIKVTLPKKIEAAFQWLGEKARAYFRDALVPSNSNLKRIGSDLVSALLDGIAKAWEGLKEIVKGLWAGLTGDIASVDQNNNAQVIGAALGDMLRKALVFAYTTVRDYLANWWNAMIAIWSDDTTSLGQKLAQSLSASAGLIIGAVILAMSPLGGILASGLVVVYDAIMVVASALGWWLIPIIAGVWGLTKLLSREGESFGETWTRVFKTIILPFFSEMYNGFISFKDRILAPLVAGVDAIREAFAGLSVTLEGSLNPTTEGAMSAGRRLGEYFGHIAEGIAKVLGLVMQGVAWLVKTFIERFSSGAVGQVIDGLFGAISKALQFVENTFTRIVDSTVEFFHNNKGILEQLFKIGAALYVAAEVVSAVTAALAFIPEALGALTIGFLIDEDATQGIVDSVSGMLSGIGTYIGKIVGDGIAALLKMVFGDGGGEGSSLLLAYLVNPFSAFMAIGAKAFEWIFNFIAKLAPAIGKAVNGIVTMVQGAITGMLTGLRDALMHAFPEAAGTIKQVFDGIISTVTFIFDTVKWLVTSITSIVGTIAHVFGRAFHTAYELVTTIIDLIVSWALTAFKWVAEKVAGVMDWVYNLAPGLFDGIGKLFRAMLDGITAAWNWIKEKVTGFWKWITDKFDSFFDIIDKAIMSLQSFLPESVVQARKAAKAERERQATEAAARAKPDAQAMTPEAMQAARENILTQAYTFFIAHTAEESGKELQRILAAQNSKEVGLTEAMLRGKLEAAQAERDKRKPPKIDIGTPARPLFDIEKAMAGAKAKAGGKASDAAAAKVAAFPVAPTASAAGGVSIPGIAAAQAANDDIASADAGALSPGQMAAAATVEEKRALDSKLATSLDSLVNAIHEPRWVATLYTKMKENTDAIVLALAATKSASGTATPKPAPRTTGAITGTGVAPEQPAEPRRPRPRLSGTGP